MRNAPTKEEIEEITKLFLSGKSKRFIATKFNRSTHTIRKILNPQGLTSESIIVKTCPNCGKKFLSSDTKQIYCHNPCLCMYDRESNVRFCVVRILRSDITRLIKSNPDAVLKLRQDMIREEGQKYTDMIFGNLLESQLAKDTIQAYDKYKHLWSD